ncbi:MAG: NCS2 family permease [Verrucomicrobia bacterium]|nr:NCS2 family permease [Verrucomicrobiota bacterium]
MASAPSAAPAGRWFVRGDVDGFFGLFIDNLLQLMLIAALCPVVCGLPRELVYGKILPGAAVSILVGNLFYAWQARRLMRQTGRTDVTALPYGINTVSLLAFIFLIMGPIYQETGNATLAWQAGLLACLLNGLMEIVCAFFGDWVRRHTPRAALLSSLAGIAITFIAMGFVFQVFASPIIALLPMLLILFTYASRARLPFGLPGGFVAVLVGVGLAWLLRALGQPFFEPSTEAYRLGFHPPIPVPGDLFALLTSATGWQYLSVIFPMGLFNVVGSLQNLESAEAAGDRFETRPSLLVNGVCSVVAAFLGSAFPTTIYIGHPGWKAMGARAGYSILNGVVISLLCLVGGMPLVLQLVPLEAALGILLWIGLIITAQAFQEVPKQHALAVGLGLIPALASWALVLIETTLRVTGSSLLAAAPQFKGDLYIHGVIALSQGFMLSSMVLAALLVQVIDRRFIQAALWAGIAALLSLTGLIHAYDLTATGVQNKFGLAAAPDFAVIYALGACFLLGLHFNMRKTTPGPPHAA